MQAAKCLVPAAALKALSTSEKDGKSYLRTGDSTL